MPDFSLREHLESQPGFNCARIGAILTAAHAWSKVNPYRSVREFLPLVPLVVVN